MARRAEPREIDFTWVRTPDEEATDNRQYQEVLTAIRGGYREAVKRPVADLTEVSCRNATCRAIKVNFSCTRPSTYPPRPTQQHPYLPLPQEVSGYFFRFIEVPAGKVTRAGSPVRRRKRRAQRCRARYFL